MTPPGGWGRPGGVPPQASTSPLGTPPPWWAQRTATVARESMEERQVRVAAYARWSASRAPVPYNQGLFLDMTGKAGRKGPGLGKNSGWGPERVLLVARDSQVTTVLAHSGKILHAFIIDNRRRLDQKAWRHGRVVSLGLTRHPAVVVQNEATSSPGAARLLTCAPDHPAADAVWAASLLGKRPEVNPREPGWMESAIPDLEHFDRWRAERGIEPWTIPPLTMDGLEVGPSLAELAAEEARRDRERGPRPQGRLVRDAGEAEELAATWMQWMGWRQAFRTRASGDGGIDAWGPETTAKGPAAAQVKFEALKTGRPAVQNLYGAGHGEQAEHWLFFSSAGYTVGAIEFADKVGVALFRFAFDGTIEASNVVAEVLLEP